MYSYISSYWSGSGNQQAQGQDQGNEFTMAQDKSNSFSNQKADKGDEMNSYNNEEK